MFFDWLLCPTRICFWLGVWHTTLARNSKNFRHSSLWDEICFKNICSYYKLQSWQTFEFYKIYSRMLPFGLHHVWQIIYKFAFWFLFSPWDFTIKIQKFCLFVTEVVLLKFSSSRQGSYAYPHSKVLLLPWSEVRKIINSGLLQVGGGGL